MTLRRALAYTFASRYVNFGLQFLTTIVIARLLSPSEVGIYSLGAAIVGVAQTLRDFGTSSYIVQEVELTQQRIRTAFTITLLVAWVIGAVVWTISRPLSLFYGESGVEGILRILSFNFALIPFGSISVALLRREMKYRSLLYVSFASTVSHSATGVVLAFSGFGASSLAWASIVGTATTIVGAFLTHPQGIATNLSLAERKRVLKFSIASSGASITSEIGLASPDLVIGRTLGMEANGLFSRASGYIYLFERFVQDSLRGVLLSYLSIENRAGTMEHAKLSKMLETVGSIALFVTGVMAVLAASAIEMLYGPQWSNAASTAQVLALAVAIRVGNPTLTAALIAGGRVNTVLQAALWSTVSKLILLLVLAPIGLIACGFALCIGELASTAILARGTVRSSMLEVREYFHIVKRIVPSGIIGIVLTGTYQYALEELNISIPLFLRLLLALLISTVGWIFAVWYLRLPPHDEIERAFRLYVKKQEKASS